MEKTRKKRCAVCVVVILSTDKMRVGLLNGVYTIRNFTAQIFYSFIPASKRITVCAEE